MRTGRGERLEPDGDVAAEALLVAVREVVADLRQGYAVPAVGLDSRLDADLGLDSLSVAELLVRTEELFGTSLAEEVLVTARTPRDLLVAAVAASGRVPTRSVAASQAATELLGVPPNEVVLVPPRTVTMTSGGKIRRTAARERYERGALEGSRRAVGWQLTRIAASSLVAATRRLGPRAVAVLYGVWALGAFGVLATVTGALLVVAPTWRLRWRLVRGAGRLLTSLTGVRVDVEGAEHLPRDRPFVVVANHASHLDPLILTLVLEEPAVFAAVADLAENPLVRLALRRMHAHLVTRGDRVRGVADAEALTGTVRSGRTVVFFPEGRRSPVPGLEPFRTGAFLVAARSGVPVVPVALRGTRTVLPVGRLLPRHATVTVTVASPVTTRQDGWQGAVELQREARRLILQHGDEPDLA